MICLSIKVLPSCIREPRNLYIRKFIIVELGCLKFDNKLRADALELTEDQTQKHQAHATRHANRPEVDSITA